MAKPTLDDIGKTMKDRADGFTIEVQVSPGSRSSSLKGVNTWRNRLEISVMAQPKKGEANKEVISVLAEALKIGHDRISMIAGHIASKKTVLVSNMSKEEAQLALGAAFGLGSEEGAVP